MRGLKLLTLAPIAFLAMAFTTSPTTVYTIPFSNKPAYLSATVDPTFNTTFRRIGGDPGTTFTFSTGGSGTWGSTARHHYSKTQPWNANNDRILLKNTAGGTPTKLVLNADYTPRSMCANWPSGDYRWHPSSTHAYEVVIVSSASPAIRWFNVDTCTVTKTINLPFQPIGIGDGEGNISNNGVWVVLHDATTMRAVNMNTGLIGPARAINECGQPECPIGWTSISPTAKFAVVNYAGGRGLRVYNLAATTATLNPRAAPAGSLQCDGHSAAAGYIYSIDHADMSRDPDDKKPDGTVYANNDIITGTYRSTCGDDVSVDNYGKPISQVTKVRLRDANVGTLMTASGDREAVAHHVSARNTARAGWVYVSFYPGTGRPFSGEVIALRTNRSGDVERFVHAHSLHPGCYDCEIHPVPNKNGTKVMFNSNWALEGDGTSGVPPTGNVQSYVLDR